jgi:hypothetical protein
VLEEDTVALMRKRVFDVAGSIGKNTKVYLNGEKLPVRGFSDYVNLYLGAKEASQRCYEKARACVDACGRAYTCADEDVCDALGADAPHVRVCVCAGERPLGDLRVRLGRPVPAGAPRPRRAARCASCSVRARVCVCVSLIV